MITLMKNKERGKLLVGRNASIATNSSGIYGRLPGVEEFNGPLL